MCDGPVILGPECADPYSPKAVRASMGSIFARPPARAELDELRGTKLALDAGAESSIAELDLESPVVVCVGGERSGLDEDVRAGADIAARIPMRSEGPESLNAGVAAAVAIHELATRMAGHA
jgi:TrmH family RNA methyltransferase